MKRVKEGKSQGRATAHPRRGRRGGWKVLSKVSCEGVGLRSRCSNLAEELAYAKFEATRYVWATVKYLSMAGATRDGCGVEDAGKVGRELSVESFVGHSKALGSKRILAKFHEGHFK